MWKKEEIEAFEALKQALAAQLGLFRLEVDKPFILRADASDRAIGAVLEQERMVEGESRQVPVVFFSRNMAKSQLNWTL